MQRWLGIGAAALLVLGAIGFVAWSVSPRQPIEPVDATFETLGPELRAVRIRGAAHYRGVLIQRPRGGLWEPETVYVYALFPIEDTMGREVRAVVRTPERPSRGIDIEYVEVEGFVDPPRAHTLPVGSEEQMAGAGYYFHPDIVVIDAWSVRTVREEPTR